MHRLAKMSEVERQHLIDDFLDDTFGDTDAIPELIAMLRAMRPELPDDPTTRGRWPSCCPSVPR